MTQEITPARAFAPGVKTVETGLTFLRFIHVVTNQRHTPNESESERGVGRLYYHDGYSLFRVMADFADVGDGMW